MDFRFRDGRGAFEKVEVASCVRLLYVLHEKTAVSSGIDSFSRPPSCVTAGEFFAADSHVQLTGGNIKLNHIAFFQQRQRTAHETFGRDMKYAGAVVGATHSGVGNADHVPYPCGEEFLGDWQLTPFGHSGGTFWARVAQDENTVGVDIEGGVVNSRVHLFVTIENNGPARVLEEAWFSGGGFDDGADDKRQFRQFILGGLVRVISPQLWGDWGRDPTLRPDSLRSPAPTRLGADGALSKYWMRLNTQSA